MMDCFANKLSRNDDACSPSLRACEAIQKLKICVINYENYIL
jgi:hypothetical protein